MARAGLVPTPTASNARQGSRSEEREGGEGPSLVEWARRSAAAGEQLPLLPTPMAADSGRGSGTYARGNPTLLGAVGIKPLGTPTASDFKRKVRAGQHDAGGGVSLSESAARLLTPSGLLPTPVAADHRSGPNASGGDRGDGTRSFKLTEVVRRLPTPTTNPQAPNLSSNQTSGPTSLLEAARQLADARDGGLLPTPAARDHKGTGRPNQLPTEMARITERDRRDCEAMRMDDRRARLRERGLLPTPTATDSIASGTAGNREATWTPEKHTGATLTDVAVRGLDISSRSGPTSEHASSSDSPESDPLAATPAHGTGHLSPSFVEWMMGFPPGWTDTLPSRSSSRSSGSAPSGSSSTTRGSPSTTPSAFTPSETPSSSTEPPTPTPSCGRD